MQVDFKHLYIDKRLHLMKEHSSLIKDLTSNCECEKFNFLSLQLIY
jgi:hypothetical protein